MYKYNKNCKVTHCHLFAILSLFHESTNKVTENLSNNYFIGDSLGQHALQSSHEEQ